MKAYTLRMEDQELDALKQLGLKERKSIKDIIMELIRERVYKKTRNFQTLQEKKMLERVAKIARRVSDEEIVASIRHDRDSR